MDWVPTVSEWQGPMYLRVVDALASDIASGALVRGVVTIAADTSDAAKLSARSALPFGPFLALATWLIWLFGPVPI